MEGETNGVYESDGFGKIESGRRIHASFAKMHTYDMKDESEYF